MRIGRLDRKITIQQTTESRTATGGVSDSWATISGGEVWAEKRDLRGYEFFNARQVNVEADTMFTIRYLSTVTEKMRIVCDSVNYDILHIAEIGRRKGQQIYARRGIV